MNDPELQPLWEAGYDLAGKLLAASLLGLPIVGDFSIDGTAVENNYSTPSAAVTSLTVMFCGAVAKSIYQTGEGEIPDYQNLQSQAMAEISVGDVAKADPFRQAAWQRATTIMNSLVDRLDGLAAALVKGEPVDATHPALKFTTPAGLDDDSLDDDTAMTALSAATQPRQWSSLASCDLAGNPL